MEHIRRTADGIITTVMGVGFGSISMLNLGTLIGYISGILGSVASVAAILYYREVWMQAKGKRLHKK